MDKSVPFIDLGRFEDGFLEQVLARVDKLLCHTQFVGGKECEELEQRLSQFCASPHALGCANGTDALQIALRALGVGPGARVLMPDLNFWAAFEAVVNVGAEPITVDVSEDSLHLDPALLEEAINKFQPKAVVMVHLYGWASPDTLRIREICSRHNVALLEDCAQSVGTLFQGHPLIGSAKLATTSFYPAKVLGASGDAGAIFCHDKEIAASITSLRNHGRREHYLYGAVGWNSRLGSYEAAFLNASLNHIGERLASRRNTLKIYREEFKNLPVALPSPGPEVQENGYLSILLCKNPQQRTDFVEHLNKNHIGHGIVYPVPITQQPAAQSYLKHKVDRGVSLSISQRILSLPCFAYMREDEHSRVCDVVRSFFAS